MNKPGIDLAHLIKHYEVHNKSEGKSPRTVEGYKEILGAFYRWLKQQGSPTAMDSVGEDEVRAFIIELQGRPGRHGKLSPHTVANRVRGLRAFFAWLARQGYTDRHLLQDLRPPKIAKPLVEPLTPKEIEQIFSVINPKTALGARNRALLSVMLDAGLRLSEVATLKADDTHLEERYVKVLGKGYKERMVGFGVACQRALLHYAFHFRPEPVHPRVDAFFLSLDGYALAGSAIQSWMVRLSKTAGIPRLHPHLLRHTYATMFLLNGGDLFLLKQNLGHTTLAMVEHYLHIASQQAAIESQGYSPLDRCDVGQRRNGRSSRPPLPAVAAGGIYPHAGLRLGGGRRASR